MGAKVIRDANAGNSHTTYYKGYADRQYCIQIGNDYARDAKGRVRRFRTQRAAEAVAERMQ